MASCFHPLAANTTASNNQDRVPKRLKPKEYNSTLVFVRNLFNKFSCFATKIDKDVQVSLVLRKIAKAYNNLPSSPAPAQNSVNKRGVKRIKVVITKQQLKELSSKSITLKDLLSCEPPTTLLSCISRDSSHVKWKPKLESIPEGNELRILHSIPTAFNSTSDIVFLQRWSGIW